MKKSKEKTAPLELKIFDDLFSSIAEEMGVVLGRTSYSPNIKERRDYSCALFDKEGEIVAQAAHLPVHLGSMPLSVKAAISSQRFNPGDMVILNDPFEGGTHLPDITVVAPVFIEGDSPLFFVANRAHHVDVGGMRAGSMPLSGEIYCEGLRIPPVKIIKNNEWDRELLRFLLSNVRGQDERLGDLEAQRTANLTGVSGLMKLCKKHGKSEVLKQMKNLQDYTERVTRAKIREIPDGTYSFQDVMDDDGFGTEKIVIKIAITVKGEEIIFDFTGTSPQVKGCVNSVYAITLSCVFYVINCLLNEEVPSNCGCLRPVKVIAPEGSLVNATFPSAVAGGNVETSQRIVDVILGALSQACPERIPAASCGTMNNLAIGGYDPFRKRPFSYYETTGGGSGGGPSWKGHDATHTHMTNTMNTPVEVLENYYPMRVLKYEIRKNSGGKGRFRGGEGIVRTLQVLCDADLSILSERRNHSPYGLSGGEPGEKGVNLLISDGKETLLPGKCNISVKTGDIISINTPGGGGFGRDSQ